MDWQSGGSRVDDAVPVSVDASPVVSHRASLAMEWGGLRDDRPTDTDPRDV